MYTDSQILDIANSIMEEHDLVDRWSFQIVDDLEGRFGFTDFEEKAVKISREHFPTYDRNVVELVKHEMAHAICGHGLHNLEWWDKLMDIGGRGVWVNEWGTVEQARITDEPFTGSRE